MNCQIFSRAHYITLGHLLFTSDILLKFGKTLTNEKSGLTYMLTDWDESMEFRSAQTAPKITRVLRLSHALIKMVFCL